MRFHRHKPQKYRNIKCTYDGIKFDSKIEAQRYMALKHLENQGKISDLKVHEPFPLIIPNLGPIKIKGSKRETTSRFIPDFVYVRDGKLVIEDVKSPITASEPYFKLKRGVFERIYGVEVKIVAKI